MSELVPKSNTPKPPFLFTFWNPFDNDVPGLGQSFLNYVNNTSIAEYGATIVGQYINEANRRQADLLEDLSGRQISAINNGFELTIEAIEDGFRFLDQRMSRIEQGIINSNILLENISELLKLPDSEKQRQRHIELGMKFSNQALKDSDLAIDSKNEFESALKLMQQDWFVLQQLGIIYLHSEKIQDLNKAKEYFLKAAKYAYVENSDSVHLINWHFKKCLSSQSFDSNLVQRINLKSDDYTWDEELPLRDFIIDCYLNAALCAYVSTNFNEAATHSLKAVEIGKENIKSLFLFSKYAARNGDVANAITYTLKTLQLAPYMADAISNERELISIPEIVDAIATVKSSVSKRLKVIKEKIELLKGKASNKIFSSIEQYPDEISPSLFYKLLDKPLLDAKSISKNKNNEILDLADYDILFTEVAKLIVTEQTGSISLIQRRFKLGYNRATSLIDQLEEAFIVGPFEGSAAREVLVKNISDLNHLLGLNDKWKLLDYMTLSSLENDWIKIENVINSISYEKSHTANKTNSDKDIEILIENKTNQLKHEKEKLNSLNDFKLFRSKEEKEVQLNQQRQKINNLEQEINEIKTKSNR